MVKHVVLNQPEAAGASAGALPHPTSAGAPSREGLIRNSLKKTHSSLMDEVSNTWAMGGHEQGWAAPSRGWAADKPCVPGAATPGFSCWKHPGEMGFCSPWPCPGSQLATWTTQIHFSLTPKPLHLGSPSLPLWPLTPQQVGSASSFWWDHLSHTTALLMILQVYCCLQRAISKQP